jgi:hypothetical protein
MSLQLKEWITYLAILLACFALFYLITPRTTYQPTGIALPITKAVKKNLLSNPQWPSSQIPSQWINVEYHVSNDSQPARQIVMQKAMDLAKATGATSVMMQPLFFADSTAQSPMLSVIIGHGIAVY